MASSLRGDQSRDSEPEVKSTSRPISLAASVARLALLLPSTLNESALDARDDMDECREYVPESWRSGVGAGCASPTSAFDGTVGPYGGGGDGSASFDESMLAKFVCEAKADGNPRPRTRRFEDSVACGSISRPMLMSPKSAGLALIRAKSDRASSLRRRT